MIIQPYFDMLNRANGWRLTNINANFFNEHVNPKKKISQYADCKYRVGH